MMEALLENAFQFTPEGGCVTFVAGSGQFSVEDEGPGIPAEVRSKVFDRFFTTVNPLTGRRGTGLGLAIVKSLADRYGAMIAITCPAGTQVRVNFTQNS
jgi:signal transduction histidine kinase